MTNSKLKIVYITDRDPVNRWVIQEIAARFPPILSLIVDWSQAQSGGWQRPPLLQYVRHVLDSKTRDRINANRDRWLAANMPHGITDLENEQVISPEALAESQTVDQLSSLAPDLIVVCGAPVLSQQVFALPSIATINVHFGISSAYRGQHGIFFPLRDRNFEQLGATAHVVDAGVNTGPVLLEYFPSIAASDHEFSLDMKMGVGIAEPIVNMLEQLEASDSRALSGLALAVSGKPIRFSDRSFMNSARHVISGLLRRNKLPTREARTNSHYRIG